MRRVAPSVFAREQLQRLLGGGGDPEQNIVSALVEAVTRLVVQELLEGEQATFSAGGAATSAASQRQSALNRLDDIVTVVNVPAGKPHADMSSL
jgi:hypothetical protein